MKHVGFQGAALPCESSPGHAGWRWACTALALAALTACGGGNSGGTKTVLGAGLSGVAVDGYLQGASVYLDVNRNGLLDDGEPSTTTDASGRYTLDTRAINGALNGMKVIVTGGVDTDTGYAFTGRLTAHVEDATQAQVVTPLTTVLDAMVSSGLATDVASARSRLAASLGLNTQDLTLDPLEVLNTKPGIYAAGVSLQKAVELLASAAQNTTPEAAQKDVIAALAQVVIAQSGKPSVKVGDLIAQLPAGTVTQTQREAAQELADALHDAIEVALDDSDRERGRDKSKAVIKAMDQLRRKAESSRDYDMGKHARSVDADLGLSVSAPVTALLKKDAPSTSTASATLRSRLTTTPAVYTQPVNTQGRLLASNCFQCHGTGGVGGFDKIRGSEAAEVREFLSKPAGSDIMAAHAQGYTTAQLNSIIAYLQQR